MERCDPRLHHRQRRVRRRQRQRGFYYRTAAPQRPAAPPAAAAPVAPTAASAATHVAVIDVGYIFKNHARFKAAMDRMKEVLAFKVHFIKS